MKANHKRKITYLFLLAIFVVIAGVVTTNLTYRFKQQNLTQAMMASKIVDEKKECSLSLVMVGDNLLHTPLIADAKNEAGEYHFDYLYQDMKDEFQNADVSVIVQETILGGKELGYSGYPMFNSPQEVGDALVRAGFDVVLSATNHALDKGERGVLNTLNFWKQYPDVRVLGIHDSFDSYQKIRYIEKNGIKLALMNYTDSTNGIPLPKEKEYLVNKVDRTKMANDLKIAEETADFSVVFMHWGTEYRFSANDAQKDMAKFLTECGADLIMGSHPHVLEPVEWVTSENGNQALVFYSLGNFVSRQKQAANLLGAMGKVVLSKKNDGTRHIASFSVVPTVTHYNKNSRSFRVYPLSKYTDELAKDHGVSLYDGKVSVERFQKIFDNVFKSDTPLN